VLPGLFENGQDNIGNLLGKSMKIAVLGIGGVGGYYGGKLAHYWTSQANVKVIFVARGQHLEQIQKHGLKLVTKEGDFTVTPSIATANPEGLGPFDLVIFCVKSYDLETSREIFRNNFNERTVFLPLLNGVDNAEKLRSFFRKGRVLNGCVYISAHIVAPGVVEQTGGSCQLFFGSEDGNIKDYLEIEHILVDAGIKAELKPNIEEVIWEKYIFISPLASVTSLLGEPFGVVMEKKESRDVTEGLVRELERIARAKGVNLVKNIVDITLDKVRAFPYKTKSSMQVDFEKGRKTEIEAFTGYGVKTARELGVDIPLHQMVYQKLKERCP
jgi:2-dehydropantoate 2-reductase